MFNALPTWQTQKSIAEDSAKTKTIVHRRELRMCTDCKLFGTNRTDSVGGQVGIKSTPEGIESIPG